MLGVGGSSLPGGLPLLRWRFLPGCLVLPLSGNTGGWALVPAWVGGVFGLGGCAEPEAPGSPAVPLSAGWMGRELGLVG